MINPFNGLTHLMRKRNLCRVSGKGLNLLVGCLASNSERNTGLNRETGGGSSQNPECGSGLSSNRLFLLRVKKRL